jgi:two-component system sensor histidine kinase HydH
MREMAATGDLTRKIAPRAKSWEDEDAKLLAVTFNMLTESIERFQREAAQRERLSALGRLSTVVAHEIRNPLMIIKASLRTLSKDHVSRDEIRQALQDVDEEVARLNRVVNDVLDFARPIRFEYAATDVNAVCTDAEQATRNGADAITVKLTADGTLKPVVTDAERLRMALVNILSNARHAVLDRELEARSSKLGAGSSKLGAGSSNLDAGSSNLDADIEIQTMNGTAGRVSIIVRDRGKGVKPEDLPRVFDPYFTTKRTGSGLGLAIAKNIIEGMGGSISLESRTGHGTEIRIDLPSHAPPAPRATQAGRA